MMYQCDNFRTLNLQLKSEVEFYEFSFRRDISLKLWSTRFLLHYFTAYYLYICIEVNILVINCLPGDLFEVYCLVSNSGFIIDPLTVYN